MEGDTPIKSYRLGMFRLQLHRCAIRKMHDDSYRLGMFRLQLAGRNQTLCDTASVTAWACLGCNVSLQPRNPLRMRCYRLGMFRLQRHEGGHKVCRNPGYRLGMFRLQRNWQAKSTTSPSGYRLGMFRLQLRSPPLPPVSVLRYRLGMFRLQPILINS